MKNKTYFPNIETVIEGKEIILSTTLRRKSVEWFSHEFKQSYSIDSMKNLPDVFQVFLRDAYAYFVVGNFTEVDQDQRSEEQRVMEDVEDAIATRGFTSKPVNF